MVTVVMYRYVTLALWVAVCLAGCAGSLAEQTHREREVVMRRAALDLDCPHSQLQTTATDHKRYPGGAFPTRYQVEGCGRSEIYVWRDLQDWTAQDEHSRYAVADGWPAFPDGARATPVPPAAGGATPR